MAFPLPEHLPRKKQPQDVSSAILSKISEANSKTLNAELAASWITELDDSIQSSRSSIRERIRQDQSSFQRQFQTAKSVQTRLHTLQTNVDDLSNAISNPETGLAPNLTRTLTQHAALSQTALNAEVAHCSLHHLLNCRTMFKAFSELVSDGDLPQAVKLSEDLVVLLDNGPPPLPDAEVSKGLKRQYRAMRDRAEEQLNEASCRGIVVSPSTLIVRPNIQVRQSSKVLCLPSILSSLSPTSLSNHLTTLRRDLTTHYIDFVLTQPLFVVTNSSSDAFGTPEQQLQLFHAPDSNSLISRVDNLSRILTFLHLHLFPTLPESQKSAFLKSLVKPFTTGVLNHLVIPHLPSSLSSFQIFLELISRAISFEEEDLSQLVNTTSEKDIKSWTDGIVSHYEKKRRIDILDECRSLFINRVHGWEETFRAEAIQPSIQAGEVHEQRDAPVHDNTRATNGHAQDLPETIDVDENGWGFEDEKDSEPVPEVTDDDPEADAWGLDDDNSSAANNGDADTADEPAWDAWDDPLPVPTGNPKPAKRLEKLTSKGKHAQQPPDSHLTSNGDPPSSIDVRRKPPDLQQTTLEQLPPPVEFFRVSNKMKELVSLFEDTLKEAEEFAQSKLLSSFPSPSVVSGTLIFQTAPCILDIFRALYSVVFSDDLSKSPVRAMQFSNDCCYLHDEALRINRLFKLDKTVQDALDECQMKLDVFGKSWFDKAIDQQVLEIDAILVPTEGFVDTAEQERFDVCEDVVNEAVQRIKRVSQQWKGILTKSRHLAAVGSVIDAALSRVLEDITTLSDIPAVESHRLSELCRIFNSLEGLFVDDPNQPSMIVAYVACWLKLSYLSELLEASMADIGYLFDEGALVDFEVEELVKLIRALFADTPLRTKTINKIQGNLTN